MLKIEGSIFLLFLFGFQKIQVAQCSGKAYQYCYNGYEKVCAVSNKLLKHGVYELTQQIYGFRMNSEMNFALKLRLLLMLCLSSC